MSEEQSIGYKRMTGPAAAGIMTGWSLENIMRSYRANPEHSKKMAVAAGVVYLTSLGATFLLRKNAGDRLTEKVKSAVSEYLTQENTSTEGQQ
ncbi:hypothetical protein JW826_06340 [Candidatus Woesearchaeota archaeon]|nr:hypothetical protein [Candidatus Woesearchaeota archaeon]